MNGKLDAIMAHLERRMMTWLAFATTLVATLEAKGISLLDTLSDVVNVGLEAAGVLYGGAVGAFAILQAYMKERRENSS